MTGKTQVKVQPPEGRMGDRTDREVPYIGGIMSPRNAGWYGATFTPTQRYTGYTLAYLMTAQAIASGTIDQVPDEVIMMLGWAPHDTHAIEAGRELAFGTQGYTDTEGVVHGGGDADQPEMQEMHNSIYGDGYFDLPGYAEFHLPKVSWEELHLPKIGMNEEQANRYAYRWSMALSGNVNYDVESGEKWQDYELQRAAYKGPNLEPTPWPFGWIDQKAGEVREWLTGQKHESSEEELFLTAYDRGHEEGDTGAAIESNVVNTASVMATGGAIGLGLKAGVGMIGAIGGALKGMGGGGQTIAQGVANGVDGFRTGIGVYGKARFPTQVIMAGTATATLAGGVIMDFMGGPTEQWNDMLTDYEQRKHHAQRTNDTTWVDAPEMEMALDVNREYTDPRRQYELFQRQRTREIKERTKAEADASRPWWKFAEGNTASGLTPGSYGITGPMEQKEPSSTRWVDVPNKGRPQPGTPAFAKFKAMHHAAEAEPERDPLLDSPEWQARQPKGPYEKGGR